MGKRWIPAVGAVVLLLGHAGKSEAQFFILPIGFGNPVFGYGNPGFGNYAGWYPGGFPFSTIPRYGYGYGGAFSNYGPISTGIQTYPFAPTTSYAPANSYVAYSGPSSTVGYVSYTIPDRPARIDVRVPSDAELWFDGRRTGQSGSERTFHTPPLEKGQGYRYEVRARWTENGKTVEQTQSVGVTAGARANVVFPKPKS
jgi:uncharacterized protein (TIGR03000 family)